MTRLPSFHLVAGFLGSGKTTAIINACKTMSAEGLRVGVITNDQGKFLVDTAFFRLADFPTVEVGGGCFCCNFVDLEKQIEFFLETIQPDAIFAESVGSCGDLVATVVKPLKEFKQNLVTPSSFSVFVDARLLRMRLLDIPLPFSDGVVYIFDQQIDESYLLVINKIDLLKPDQLEELLTLAANRYPEKKLLPQISLHDNGVTPWLDLIQSSQALPPEASLDMDYARYGQGEQHLAWLNERIQVTSITLPLRDAAVRIITAVMDSLNGKNIPIGHLKFMLVTDHGENAKISFTSIGQTGWEEAIPRMSGKILDILINGRVEFPAQQLEELIYEAILRITVKDQMLYNIIELEAFHPADPSPTYRL